MLCQSLFTPSKCKAHILKHLFLFMLDWMEWTSITFSQTVQCLYVIVNICISSKPKLFCPTDIRWSLCELKKLFICIFLGGVLSVLFRFFKLMESVLCSSIRLLSNNSRVIPPRDVQKWTGCTQLSIEGSSLFGKSAAAWQLCIFLPCSKTEAALNKEPLSEEKFGVRCCQTCCTPMSVPWFITILNDKMLSNQIYIPEKLWGYVLVHFLVWIVIRSQRCWKEVSHRILSAFLVLEEIPQLHSFSGCYDE